MEEVIEILTKLLIKEHIKGNNEILTMTKEDMIKFCIKLLKVIEEYI